MATLTVTVNAGSPTGDVLRKLGQRVIEMASNVPDTASTGAATVVTFDNAPATGLISVQITAGPYQSNKYTVG